MAEYSNVNRGATLTQDLLKQLIFYDPESGECTRIQKTAMRHKIGEVVGSLDKSTGYKRVTLFYKQYWIHRIIWLYMTGDMPNVIDHINHNPQDNRFQNLRNTTQSGNMRNRFIPTESNTKVTGVYKRSDCNSFSAEIANVKLGCFKSFFEAVCARKSAELLYSFHINHGKSLQEVV